MSGKDSTSFLLSEYDQDGTLVKNVTIIEQDEKPILQPDNGLHTVVFSDDSFAVAYTVQDTGGGGYGGGYGRRLNSNDDLHERVQWFNSDLTKRGDATEAPFTTLSSREIIGVVALEDDRMLTFFNDPDGGDPNTPVYYNVYAQDGSLTNDIPNELPNESQYQWVYITAYPGGFVAGRYNDVAVFTIDSNSNLTKRDDLIPRYVKDTDQYVRLKALGDGKSIVTYMRHDGSELRAYIALFDEGELASGPYLIDHDLTTYYHHVRFDVRGNDVMVVYQNDDYYGVYGRRYRLNTMTTAEEQCYYTAVSDNVLHFAVQGPNCKTYATCNNIGGSTFHLYHRNSLEELYESVSPSATVQRVCQTCTACGAGQVEATACSPTQNRVCEAGQCTTMPVDAANSTGQGTCTGTLTHGDTCQLSCAAGYHPAAYTCDTETLIAPATPCMACAAHEHSDGDSACAADAGYTECTCTTAACSEAVPLDKYFVIGNSDADDSQCLDATIKEASDCPDDSEFTSANTGTTDGVCTPCTGGLVSTSGAACGCGDAAANNYLQPGICTYDHSCANGTPDTADAATAGVEKCSSCDNLYRLEGDGCVIAASAAVCNPQRKPFVAGATDCGAACALTAFASGDECIAYDTITCPDGEDRQDAADSACAACATGTFSAGGVNCVAHSTVCADATKYISAAGTNIADVTCTPLTVCTATQSVSVAATATTDRQCGCLDTEEAAAGGACVCKAGFTHDGTMCVCPAHQHAVGGACVNDVAYDTCGCSDVECTEMGANFFSIGEADNQDNSECRAPTFAEQKIGTVTRAKTSSGIKDLFASFKTAHIDTEVAATHADKKAHFRSVVKYLRREIRALPSRKVAVAKESIVASPAFISSIPDDKEVELVVPKTKTAAVDVVSTACDESDIDVSAQANSYSILLEDGETSVVCDGDDAKTKLKRTGETTYEYSCGDDWATPTAVNEGDDYTCAGMKFYVSSLSGSTCEVTPPTSVSFPSVVAGTSANCSATLGEGDSCVQECGANFVKESEASCAAGGVFTPASCACTTDGFVDNGAGQCEKCTNGFSTGGGACQAYSKTMFECNELNSIFVPGTSSTDSSCGSQCGAGLVPDGELCKEAGSTLTCGTLSWMYFSDVCCESELNTVTCAHSLGESDMKLLDSATTLKQVDGSDCEDGMAVIFSGGRLICKAS